MRRRTLICVSFAVALHGAAYFALDRWWILAATHRPAVGRDSVIELVQSVPEPVEIPVALVPTVRPPPLTPTSERERLPEPKTEMKFEPKPEFKLDVIEKPVTQLAAAPPALPAAVVVVASVTPARSFGSASTTVPLNAIVATAAVNPPAVANDRPSTAPVATQPAYLKNPKPTYPVNARLKRQEGVVLLAVEVSAQGKPVRVEVETSSGFASLDEAALNTVLRRWRFTPAQLAGISVANRVQVPVRFQLND